ncbi:restriction endonuclease subunit S [Stenotrophomonas sp. Sm10]|uniref:restriction endonuclease subunit S n=1 Tax=Stenotrophomonas sp. Sm10 TaxID=3002754 RepID=UPI0027E3D5B7|nr:restriction endonuclease subunit S [Stenotrophomonas sp. Sm10]MDQ7312886.1 restriction endonuclease subunit S [Stenotrophomonas sp. Sm10]
MKPDKITTHGLLEVCDLIPGKRGKVSEGSYYIYGAGKNTKGTTDKFNCESDTIRLTRKGTVGAVYFHRDPFWMEEASFKVEPKEMIDKRYLFHWLLMKREEIERCADGDNQPGLSLARLSKITIDIPDMEYQLKAVKLLNEMSADLDFFIDNITQTKINQSKVLSYYSEKIGTALERETNEQ